MCITCVLYVEYTVEAYIDYECPFPMTFFGQFGSGAVMLWLISVHVHAYTPEPKQYEHLHIFFCTCPKKKKGSFCSGTCLELESVLVDVLELMLVLCRELVLKRAVVLELIFALRPQTSTCPKKLISGSVLVLYLHYFFVCTCSVARTCPKNSVHSFKIHSF